MLKVFTKYMDFPLSYQSLNLGDMLPIQSYSSTFFRPWKYLIEFSDYPQLIFEISVMKFWSSSIGLPNWVNECLVLKSHGPSSQYIQRLLEMISNDCKTWLLWINIGYILWSLLGLESLLPIFLVCVGCACMCVCVCVCVCVFGIPIDTK